MSKQARQDIARAASEAAAALWNFERTIAKHADADIGEDMALAVVVAKPVAQDALSVLAARFHVERTPETVLRAMITVYGEAEIVARVASRAEPLPHYRRAAHLHACRDELVGELAEVANGWPGPDLSQPELQGDYEARLSGTRPLDAPPMEEP